MIKRIYVKTCEVSPIYCGCNSEKINGFSEAAIVDPLDLLFIVDDPRDGQIYEFEKPFYFAKGHLFRTLRESCPKLKLVNPQVILLIS